MQEFYPPILKFVIVAVLAVIFISVVFVPQQDATTVMGDYMDKALSSVSEEFDAYNTYTGEDVIRYIKTHCKSGNTTVVKVDVDGTEYTFQTNDETTTPSGETRKASEIINDSDKFERDRPYRDEITFTKVS